ncbi:transposable element Tcb1 transposase [Trichonephila clavipes]|nr:transposable element Tcb1 transposase [Trichonephila clavipes]
MVAQPLIQITLPAATPDQLCQRVEAAWSAVAQDHIQSLFESMPRRVAAVISNNGGYSIDTDSGKNHTSQKFDFDVLHSKATKRMLETDFKRRERHQISHLPLRNSLTFLRKDCEPLEILTESALCKADVH